MKIRFTNFFVLSFIALTASVRCFSQVLNNNTAAIANTVNYFDNTIGRQSMLYNGPEYHYGNPKFTGNAFFQDVNNWQTGSVDYDGFTYKNVSLKYDLYNDVIVVLLYNKFTSFSLLTERVNWFSLADHHFIRIAAKTLDNNNSSVDPGFYDQLYDGKVSVLARRTKSLQTSTGTLLGIETYYLPKTKYFLKKGNTYYSIGSQGSMLSVLKDRKKELEQYLRTNNIRFKDNPETNMAKIASYYDRLTN